MRKTDNLPPYRAVVKKSGSLNFLDRSGPAQVCYGRTLPLYMNCKFLKVNCMFWNSGLLVTKVSNEKWYTRFRPNDYFGKRCKERILIQ